MGRDQLAQFHGDNLGKRELLYEERRERVQCARLRKCRCRFRCKIAKRSARDTDPPGNLDASIDAAASVRPRPI